ncbi:WD40-repeat-containing domain protein [Russula vinacea]|nr:WD40-repeat-containing domain protein [Russula vinacea]
MLKKTLNKHYDSINTLAFSCDGSLFASGADDGLIIIFQGHGSGWEVRRFQVKAPVTTLLWHSRFGYTVVAGDASGDVHMLCLQNDSSNRNSFYHALNSVPGPVHCMAQSGIWLAIGSGKVVQVIKQGTINSPLTWVTNSYLGNNHPPAGPAQVPELEGDLPEPMARSLHFLGANEDVLLVTYLDHGVVAWNLKTLEINWHIRP